MKKVIEEPVVKKEDSLKERYHTLCIDGDKYKTLYTEKYKKRVNWEKPDPKKFYSEIPGTIIKIHVTVGQKVQEGDLMLVLEAMKMKNKLIFPISGTVKKIYVEENQKIPRNTLMIELK
ncbi:MAG: acetyl-CoA carboxylase biotin carboxyl carrier protein subunit [Bacteroidales bacterium]